MQAVFVAMKTALIYNQDDIAELKIRLYHQEISMMLIYRHVAFPYIYGNRLEISSLFLVGGL
jgi:hypothetical protein